MKRKIALVCALPLCLAACASTPEPLDATNSAELGFASPGSPGGLPGRFAAVDGRRIEGGPASIRVAAGTRTVEYNCPDTITMDSLPAVKATFIAGRRYVLACKANEPGVITERRPDRTRAVPAD